jgi:hypothetical protein
MSSTLTHFPINTLVEDPKPSSREWVFFRIDILFAYTITRYFCQFLFLSIQGVGQSVDCLGGFDD